MKEQKAITMSLLKTRELYEEHIGPMPGNMEYLMALMQLVEKFGMAKVQQMSDR
jgi:hypothetical protein